MGVHCEGCFFRTLLGLFFGGDGLFPTSDYDGDEAGSSLPTSSLSAGATSRREGKGRHMHGREGRHMHGKSSRCLAAAAAATTAGASFLVTSRRKARQARTKATTNEDT